MESRPGSDERMLVRAWRPIAQSPTRRESIMRGRHAIGPEIAERVEGSELAKTRLRAVLETIARRKRVRDVCKELGICEQLFERIRAECMQGAAAKLELKSAGRPPKATSAAEHEIVELKERIAELEAQLQAAEVRAELATTLPRLAGEAGKKR
jgi:transposase-like protein